MNITRFPRKLRESPSIPQIKKVYSENILKYKRYGFLGLPGGSVGKESTCNAEDTRDSSCLLGWEDPLEEVIATHSSILA